MKAELSHDYRNADTIQTIIRFTEADQLESITCPSCECVANTIVKIASEDMGYECVCRRCQQQWWTDILSTS